MIISDMRHPICGALAACSKVLDYVATTAHNFVRLFPQLSCIWCKILQGNLTLNFLSTPLENYIGYFVCSFHKVSFELGANTYIAY
jgi:hypothetical protein